MAIEAVKQTASPNRPILGFHIKEAHFINPMVVGESAAEPTESMVRLSRLQNPLEKEPFWSEILICAYAKERWVKCFRAILQVQYEEARSQVDTEMERELELERIVREYNDATGRCTNGIKPGKFYAHSLENGFKYGDTFRSLRNINWDQKTVSTARIQQLPTDHRTTSLVHPAVLDSAFHLSIVQISQGCSRPLTACVPYQLFNTWVSARGWDPPSPNSSMRLASSVSGTSGSRTEVSIYVLSANGTPLASLGRLVMASISHKSPESPVREEKIIHRIEWKPQLSLQSPRQLHQLCHADSVRRDETSMACFYQQLVTALVKSTKKSLADVPQLAMQNAPVHLKRFASSMKRLIEKHESTPTRFSSMDDQTVEMTLSQTKQENPSWAIFPVVAQNLVGIFLGETDVLELLFTAGLAESYYRHIFDHICDQRLHRYMELISHETPGLKILEIGAGTGGMTRHVLAALHELEDRTGTSRFGRYDYTDISPSFFENARSEFAGSRISFQALDIEDDPTKQGFELGTYDLVIAGSVLHATASLTATLGNVHDLLKAGGQLLCFEVVCPESICANVGFGLLPGWWLGQESYRQDSPLITEEQWDEVLRVSGFSGADLFLRDYEDDMCHLSSIMVSTARERPYSSQPRDSCLKTSIDHGSVNGTSHSIIFIVNEEKDDQLILVSGFGQMYDSTTVLRLDQLPESSFNRSDVVVSLLEIDAPLLVDLSEANFGKIQRLIQMSRCLVWVTSPRPQDTTYSHFGVVTGLFRTVRAEASEKHIVTLAIESDQRPTPQELTDYIGQVLGASVRSNSSSSPAEVEFIVRNGHLLSGRLVENIEFDEKIRSMVSCQRKNEPLGPGQRLALTVGTVGMLDTLQFVEDGRPVRVELGPEEVEVEVEAWAVSFRDVFLALGRLPADELGWDCAGVVARVGAGCTLRPGDRVGLGARGAMRTHITTALNTTFRIPEGVSFQEAASFINPACTAYHCLVNVARLQKSEKILIHSAAGSTGQMAVWIAKHCGAEIFATVGSPEKKKLLTERFGIPASHIFYSRNSSFAQGVARLTGGSGVDVVLNSLSGDNLRATWDCIGAYGRFVEIGKADITTNSSLPMANFQNNVSFFAVDLYHLANTKPDFVSGLMHGVLNFIACGILQYPYPRHVFPVSEIEKAFRFVQGGSNAGRVIVTINQSDIVPVRDYILSRFKNLDELTNRAKEISSIKNPVEARW